MHEISVLIASASSEDSGESAQRRLARVFAARIFKVLKVWVKMKSEKKWTTSFAGYISTRAYYRHLHICDKYQNIVCWPILLITRHPGAKYHAYQRTSVS